MKSRTLFDKLYIYIMVFFILWPLLSMYLELLTINSIIKLIFISLFFYLPILFYILNNIRMVKIDIIIVFAFILLYFFYNSKIHPNYLDVYSNESRGFWSGVFNFRTGVFGYLIIRIAPNIKTICKGLFYAGIVNFIMIFWLPIYYLVFNKWALYNSNIQTNMEFSYVMLFSLLTAIIFHKLVRFKIFIYFIVVYSLVSIVLFGSRGTLSLFIIFVIVRYIHELLTSIGRYSNRKNKSGLKIVLALIIFAMIYFNIEYIIQLLNTFGIESRSLSYIFENSFIESQGRLDIYHHILLLIESSPFFGFGPLSDQVFLGIGNYSHNFILEVILNFGLTIGITMLTCLFLNIIFLSIKIKDKTFFSIFFLFITLGLLKLQVSSSFWYDTFFWSSLGLIYTIKKKGVDVCPQE